MGDWSTYEVGHFVPFTREVYDRLFLAHFEAWWPGQLVALALLIGVAMAYWRGNAPVFRALLGVAWISVGATFFVDRLAELLWAAPHIGVMFIVQGGALWAWPRLELVEPRRRLVIPAVLVAVVWFGLTGVEVFASTPNSTACVTLLLLAGTRRTLAFWAIPAMWCLLSVALLVGLG